MARPEVVEALVDSGCVAMMETAQEMNATPQEALSAHFTILNRSIKAVLDMTAGPVRQHNQAEMLTGIMELFKSAEGKIS